SWTSSLPAYRAGLFNPGFPTEVQNFTIAFEGGTNSVASLPAGYGVATLLIDNQGNTLMTGTLADGQKFTQQSLLSPYGQWPLYASLYSGKGSVRGWMTAGAGFSLSGTPTWTR